MEEKITEDEFIDEVNKLISRVIDKKGDNIANNITKGDETLNPSGFEREDTIVVLKWLLDSEGHFGCMRIGKHDSDEDILNIGERINIDRYEREQEDKPIIMDFITDKNAKFLDEVNVLAARYGFESFDSDKTIILLLKSTEDGNFNTTTVTRIPNEIERLEKIRDRIDIQLGKREWWKFW